ncbi:hypothetical protein EV182_002317 [Spiromyces aspiralis]|uniref:Uncharacterized protein n=1 Tax=Spiromyces aspiralis TaxID=68401 RepID=A0ACC1HTD7_9FUNG|nr:hypothetical protein EV182_002317 [Spiromyces aspiralis]
MSSPYYKEALHLYRHLLRSSRRFGTYNFREYVYRRTRDAFRANQHVGDPDKIRTLLDEGQRQLKIAERQGAINSMFAMHEIVIETSPEHARHRR